MFHSKLVNYRPLIPIHQKHISVFLIHSKIMGSKISRAHSTTSQKFPFRFFRVTINNLPIFRQKKSHVELRGFSQQICSASRLQSTLVSVFQWSLRLDVSMRSAQSPLTENSPALTASISIAAVFKEPVLSLSWVPTSVEISRFGVSADSVLSPCTSWVALWWWVWTSVDSASSYPLTLDLTAPSYSSTQFWCSGLTSVHSMATVIARNQ